MKNYRIFIFLILCVWLIGSCATYTTKINAPTEAQLAGLELSGSSNVDVGVMPLNQPFANLWRNYGSVGFSVIQNHSNSYYGGSGGYGSHVGHYGRHH